MTLTNYTAEQAVDLIEIAWSEELILAINFKNKQIAIINNISDFNTADVILNSRDYSDVYDFIIAINEVFKKHMDKDKELFKEILMLLGTW